MKRRRITRFAAQVELQGQPVARQTHQRVFGQMVDRLDRPLIIGFRDPNCKEWDWRRALLEQNANAAFWLCPSGARARRNETATRAPRRP